MNGAMYTIEEFTELVQEDVRGFVFDVCRQVNNRRPTENEMQAMQSSYPEMSKVFAEVVRQNPSMATAHVAMVKFEYKLPSAPAWCDVILLGRNRTRREVMIFELKDWHRNSSDRPGEFEGVIEHQGNSRQEHPADQVRGYTQYCKNFHSAVISENAEVNGCVFFTRNIDITPYCAEPNYQLTQEYPVFNVAKLDELATYVGSKITESDGEWATRFVNGYYQQNRNILKQVAQSFAENADARPFVLLGAQRTGYLQVMHRLDSAVRHANEKRVIIVSGPPGSGKSAIALNLWAEAVRRYTGNADGSHPGNVVFVATSSSQNDNWQNVFARYSNVGGAEGLVMRSNNFNPGMTGGTMKRVYLPIFKSIDPKYLRDENSLKYEYFRDYTNYMLGKGLAKNYKDNHHFFSIVDEAHALINPLAPGFMTNKLGGWCMQMGPQVYHIIRESRVSVFLLDGEQSFRDNETTTMSDIMRYASELGASVEEIDLSGLQFRCAGSVQYVDWVDSMFARHATMNVALWRDDFKVSVHDNTGSLEDELRAQDAAGACVRLLSSCSVPWISSKSLDAMHTKGDVDCDFDFENEDGTRFRRHWNNPERMDIFVQAPPHTLMHEDPLCEVGCPYEIRGFDFDYVGILWLDDVVWRKGKWYVDLSRTVDRANTSSAAQAREEQKAIRRRLGYRGAAANTIPLVPVETDAQTQPKTAAFIKRVVQAYRILMTRAVRGVGLYIHDRETRDHVREMLRA